MRRFMVRLGMLAIAAGVLGGCSLLPATSSEPVGVGRGRDEFPRSPCACGPAFYVNGRTV
ncbi:hypothetical protein SAMN02982917_1972 [Azospirillum oryzae]|uniref:Uncharacterized protein n=1 Tax=Azospirillum oryzae TaxID=286727 RepID=A0A1X7ESK6_9PROT|nr:hypothetical protein SAMN02982917_1972 [Azospirillum oryzae]